MLGSSPKTSWSLNEKKPTTHPSTYIHETAVLIGDVRLGEKVHVCPGAVIRGDEGMPIVIGDGSNIQDCVVMHALKDSSIRIGKECSLAHGCVVHGPCVLGDKVFIGFNSVVFKSEIGSGSVVLHNCLVSGGVKVGANRLVPSGSIITRQEQADALEEVPEHLKEFNPEVVHVNMELAKGYLER